MGVSVAHTLADNHKGLLKQAKQTARYLGYLASRAVRLYLDVGAEPRRKVTSAGPSLSITQHVFEQVSDTCVRCIHCLRVARTPASYQTLFNSKCTGPPVLGEGHILVKWGPAAICERCGAYSPHIAKFARNILLVCPGPLLQ